jgi:hypothetical protein
MRRFSGGALREAKSLATLIGLLCILLYFLVITISSKGLAISVHVLFDSGEAPKA